MEISQLESKYRDELAQIAKEMGITRPTVYSYIKAAFTKMRRRKLPSEWIE